MGRKHTLYYDVVKRQHRHDIAHCKNSNCRAEYAELLMAEEPDLEEKLEKVEDIENRMYIL